MPRTLRIRSAGDDAKFLQERLNSFAPTALPLLIANGSSERRRRSACKNSKVTMRYLLRESLGHPHSPNSWETLS